MRPERERTSFPVDNEGFKAAAPSLFGTWDSFHERQFFHRQGLGVWRQVQAKPGSLVPSPAAFVLLCPPVPKRPQTGTSPWPGGQGPLA